MEIEVFRAGNAAASAAGITAADLVDIASFDCSAHPVPNVIGHPRSDSPANGAVVKFRAEGNSLFADVPETLPAFKPIVEGIKGSTILGRSMAFFGKNHPSNPTPGKLAPKHLGFLGGAAPGVAGMPALATYFAGNPATSLAFSADDVLEVSGDPLPAVVFEAAPTDVIVFTEAPAITAATTKEPAVATDAEIAQFNADKAAHDARVLQFNADQKAAREGANAARVDSLVTAGKVVPADKDDLVAAFNAIDDGEVIAFASDANKAKASPVAIIAGIMAKAGNATPAGQGRTSPTDPAPEQEHQFSSVDGSAGGKLGEVRAEKFARYGS